MVKDVDIIDDPEFTFEAFRDDPFRWVDATQYELVNFLDEGDMLVERNPIDGYPSLFNAIAMDGTVYALIEHGSGHEPRVLGVASCRHLILASGNMLSMSELPPHQAVLASIITMSQRDVSAFSPMIQVQAIIAAAKGKFQNMTRGEAHDLLISMLRKLHDDFMETPDESRKQYIFYYMLYVALHIKPKESLFDEYFGDHVTPFFVFNALSRMSLFQEIHDAVREHAESLVRTAAKVYPRPFVDGQFALEISRGRVSLTDRNGLVTRFSVVGYHASPRTRTQVGYRRSSRRASSGKEKPSTTRIGVPLKRKVRKERPNVLTGIYIQSLITDWSHGKYQLPPGINNKCPGVVVNDEVSINMKNAKMADAFIDYLLAVSGDIGEHVAQQSDILTTMKQRRAFVKAIYKRADQKLGAKEYGEWAMRFVRSMVRDSFLNTEASGIVGAWDLSHGIEKSVKRTVYASLLNRLAAIYVPAG